MTKQEVLDQLRVAMQLRGKSKDTEKGNSAATVNVHNSAFRFLYGEAMDILLNPKKLPTAISILYVF